MNRPVCISKKCGQPAALIRRTESAVYWRKWCSTCHNKRTAQKHGLDNISQVVARNAGFNSVSGYLNQQAQLAGFKNLTDRVNAKHPYKKYRLDYCENRDSRLGFRCTTTVVWDGMLDVDHKNGRPNDNRPRNLQTLCKCCHAYKTNIKKDYSSPGRKQLAVC